MSAYTTWRRGAGWVWYSHGLVLLCYGPAFRRWLSFLQSEGSSGAAQTTNPGSRDAGLSGGVAVLGRLSHLRHPAVPVSGGAGTRSCAGGRAVPGDGHRPHGSRGDPVADRLLARAAAQVGERPRGGRSEEHT